MDVIERVDSTLVLQSEETLKRRRPSYQVERKRRGYARTMNDMIQTNKQTLK